MRLHRAPRRPSLPPLPYPTFCGCDVDEFRVVEEVLRGEPHTDESFAQAWRDRRAFKAQIKRQIVQTGTGEVA